MPSSCEVTGTDPYISSKVTATLEMISGMIAFLGSVALQIYTFHHFRKPKSSHINRTLRKSCILLQSICTFYTFSSIFIVLPDVFPTCNVFQTVAFHRTTNLMMGLASAPLYGSTFLFYFIRIKLVFAGTVLSISKTHIYVVYAWLVTIMVVFPVWYVVLDNVDTVYCTSDFVDGQFSLLCFFFLSMCVCVSASVRGMYCSPACACTVHTLRVHVSLLCAVGQQSDQSAQ